MSKQKSISLFNHKSKIMNFRKPIIRKFQVEELEKIGGIANMK
jgi:hypothetical protein